MSAPILQRAIAEAVGSFALVFAGTGAIVVAPTTHGAVTQVGVSLTFGLIVLAMIYALGDVSGCHLNPAVTLGFYVARRFEGRFLVPYILSQTPGATLASLTLRMTFPSPATLGACLAMFLCRCVQPLGCCRGGCAQESAT